MEIYIVYGIVKYFNRYKFGGLMMISKKKLILYSILFLTCISGCGSDKKAISASTIFTSQIKDSITEIVYYANDTGVKLRNKDDREKVYDLLSSLSLTEASKDDVKIDGGIDMEIITDELSLKFHLTSKIISINDKIYNYDKDILSDITKIFEPYFLK